MFCHVIYPHSLVTGFVLMFHQNCNFSHFLIKHYHGGLSDPDKLLKKIKYFSIET
jgi:hypothetical protein